MLSNFLWINEKLLNDFLGDYFLYKKLIKIFALFEKLLVKITKISRFKFEFSH